MKSPRLGILVALGLACASVATARAAPPDMPRVAVVPMAAINVSGDEADALAERLRQDLGSALEIDVLDRPRTQAGTGAGVKDSCMSQARCIRALGARLEVDQILFLAIIRIGDRIQIEVTWADARSGKTETREPVRLDNKDQAQAMFERAAARLVPGAAPRSPAPDSTPPDSGPPPAMTNPARPSGSDTTPGATPGATPAVAPAAGPIDAAPTGRHMTLGVWIAGGIGVAALVGGSISGAKALGTESELETCAASMTCPIDPDRVDDLRLQRDLADIMFATAIVAGVTAGILYWRSGPSGARVDVAATPAGTAITFTTAF